MSVQALQYLTRRAKALKRQGAAPDYVSTKVKRELPRIPFAPSPRPSPGVPGEGAKSFWAFSKAGEKLAKLHLDYEKLKPWELEFVETPGVPLSYRVEDKMRLP